jgi:hypothetical protein
MLFCSGIEDPGAFDNAYKLLRLQQRAVLAVRLLSCFASSNDRPWPTPAFRVCNASARIMLQKSTAANTGRKASRRRH